MGIQNTVTIAQTIQWASFMTQNRPMTLQGISEPALTCANMIADAILAPPFKWPWNRASVSFTTVDPTGWQANTNYPNAGYAIVDSNGNMQSVTTPGTSGATVPTWNTSIGGTTVDGTVTWTNLGLGSDYSVSAPSFGFIENATLTDLTVPKVWDIPNKTRDLTRNLDKGRWMSLAPFLDDNNGNIVFRATPGIPDKIYTAAIQYQKRAVPFTSLANVWPIPNMYQQIYSTGFLGMMWLFADDPRSAFLLQRFAAMVIAVSDGLTEQEKNSFLEQWDVTAASRRAAAKAQQAFGARGAS